MCLRQAEHVTDMVGRVQNMNDMEMVWAQGFKALCFDPSEAVQRCEIDDQGNSVEPEEGSVNCGVMLTEGYSPTKFVREQKCEMMFEKFGVHNFYLQGYDLT